MARLENIRVQLKSFRWTKTPTHLVTEFKSMDRAQAKIPLAAENFIKLLNGSLDLRECLMFLHAKKQTASISEVLDWLRLLYKADLIQNRHELEPFLLENGWKFEVRNLLAKKLSLKAPLRTQFTPDHIRQLLKRTTLFHQTSDDMLERIIQNSKVLSCTPGDFIIKKGSLGKSIYVLLKGHLGVFPNYALSPHQVIAYFDYLNVFGESAAILGKKRTADVIDLEGSEVLEINIHQVIDINKSEEMNSLKSLKTRVAVNQMLSMSPLFKDVPSDALHLIFQHCQLVSVEASKTLIQEGETESSFYILLRGSVAVIKGGVTIHTLLPGDHFGEIAALTDSPRTATVRAVNDCLCLRLSQASLFEVIVKSFRLGVLIENKMKIRLQENDVMKNNPFDGQEPSTFIGDDFDFSEFSLEEPDHKLR